MAKYSRGVRKEMQDTMRKFKKKKLKIGKSKTIVKKPKQAVAIGLSKSRRRGSKVPSKQS